MEGIVKIKNCPVSPRKYIVARMVNGELWYYGSWDELEKAEECKGGFDNALVLEVKQ